ncbi:MAG TPA: HDIG domain-containing protein [Bacteroidetes bacterium]|nr:HDIG domain-containing protein [Bacteroidota bacterium]
MKNIISYLRANTKGILRILYLIATIIIIVYLFPREGKFRYEFQRGKPWLHEDLYAPYDFPVYKTMEELQAEKDSILKDFKPYFKLDTNVVINEIEKLRKNFDEKWENFIRKHYDPKQESAGNTWKEKMILREKEQLYRITSGMLLNLYNHGIVEVADAFTRDSNPSSTIVILRGNIAEQTDTTSVFTLKTAYEYLKKHTNGIPLTMFRDQGNVREFLTELNLNDYVEPNLFYDREASQKVKESMISGLSLTRGMVQRGERIISRGEIVNAHTYQILESLKIEYEKRLGASANHLLVLLGQFLLVTVILLMLFLFLMYFRTYIFAHSKDMLFIFFLLIIFVGLSRWIISNPTLSYYLIPLAIVPIIIRTFYDARLALFIYMILLMIVGFFAPNSFEFVFMNFIAGIIAIISLTNIYRRNKFIMSAVMVFISYSIVYLGYTMIQEGSLENMHWMNYIWFSGNAFLVLLSFPLVYIFEKTFGFLSDATLVELADTNQPLLRELAEKAPGTFQHSLQVANLAEEAVRIIGGNQLLIRAGALYHDIGKMINHVYFTENQREGMNLHEELSFKESAAIIIGHVTKGVEIARKHNLPKQITDFIRTHHGTTKVQYFYRNYIHKYPDKSSEVVDFTYPGPKPFTREMAILMMADSVEAASRSLKDYSEDILGKLVEDIIDYQLREGQFNEAPITFRDISKIKEIFKNRLTNIYHARIEYPKFNEE